MSTGTSPTVQRRRLRTELRGARQHAGLTQEQVADAMEWSLSKVIRIETGSVGISRNDLYALLNLYKVDSSEQTYELVALARAARQQSWWSSYRDKVSPVQLQYLEYEGDASAIWQYEALLIPGLLQTEEYATAAIKRCKGRHPGRGQTAACHISPSVIQTRAEIQMTRQQLLQRPDPPRLFCILDEAVVQRTIGDEKVGHAQITQLITMANNPQVTIQIMPFNVGIYGGMAESFTIFEFPNVKDQDVLYFESSQDTFFRQDEAEVINAYRRLFRELRDTSLGPEGSLTYLIEQVNA